ncbi:uncharacterized protein LOC120841033 [Ixodes scapularis]|uniref:uncharacterized protein LOC120841033 n=1 Tax=Ixodes scapularis TaxID=6945 RepID=UPI001C38544B|nr:uncharacterized protein LOC120841033 [Ixodes scapularis]
MANHKTDYRRLIAKVVKEAGKDPVVIAGDFNAPHPGWGYKDTCPDLTLVKNVANAEWTNLMEQLGSDHCILETTIHESGYTRKTGKARITDWDRWRKQRGKGAASIESIEDWSSEVIASVKPFVAEVELSEKTPAMDTRLLHLWEARRGLARRWKKQRYNKKLRKRIQALTKLAEDYAVDLARKNWRAYKNALGLPERTATEKLLKLGMHNTIEELHEAQLVSQLKRLSSTVNGAWLLDKLGMAVPGGSHGPGDAGEELPAETRQRFTISRIPRNMHPDRNAERRQARAVALARSWDSREGTLYVDGAGPVLGVAAIAVASAQGQIRRVASVRAQTVEQVEEAAIALAVVCNPRATIISDSQRACQNFARGVVGQPALRLLRKTAVEGVHLIWTPGHMGQVGNEAANAAARGALYRDSVLPQRDLDNALTHSEALKALRTHRAEYPGPAKGLSKEEEFTWRRLQTDTFVTPIQLHLWYPERYATADCPFCGEPWVDVYHVVWACKNLPGLAPVEEPKLEEWEAGLKYATASEQRVLVARALRVHSALGAPE